MNHQGRQLPELRNGGDPQLASRGQAHVTENGHLHPFLIEQKALSLHQIEHKRAQAIFRAYVGGATKNEIARIFSISEAVVREVILITSKVMKQQQHESKTIEVPLKDILPNRYRDIDNYPIQREKVDALIQSFKSTGYWANILGRLTKDGKVEATFGRHRLAALEETHKSTDKIPVTIQDLSDAEMLRAMVDENQDVWSHDFLTTLESVQAVIDAANAGTIQLVKSPAGRTFYAQGIAEFLNWTKSNGKPSQKLENALAALELIENGILNRDHLRGLGSEQVRYVVAEASKASKLHPESEQSYKELTHQIEVETKQIEKEIKEAKTPEEEMVASSRLKQLKHDHDYSKQQEKLHHEAPKKIVEKISKGLREGKFGKRQVKQKVAEILSESDTMAPLPPAMKLVFELNNELFNFLNPHLRNKGRAAKLEEI